nr:hypothetical protein [Tanacetum cinerariifolium]
MVNENIIPGDTRENGNSFEVLNLDNMVIEEVEMGNKASTSGVVASKDKVESVDNEIVSYLASKSSEVGYGTKSLLEQWRKTYANADYDPYDDDMHESQEIPNNIRSTCDNLNIKVCLCNELRCWIHLHQLH